jgi:hypothetical protein
MPDYVVLISTLGGMALFGLSGFVLGPAIAALFMAAWELFATMQLQVEEQLNREIAPERAMSDDPQRAESGPPTLVAQPPETQKGDTD